MSKRDLDWSHKFRLKKINKVKNYFIEEITKNELMS